ncbi:ankyrin repeat and SOCS box protein 8-like [Acanthaster planci]|uniref:Ankyrin repeat and SOCS box protein 8-like n=1 Tax=Acanthaster planci TaxID=133434 RepID=A0A8B7Y686_ACAPL|nr:ankyrin repeat and SOCS box protein 8-like [Acanthaster planci]
MGGLSTRIRRPVPTAVSPISDPIGYICSCILKRDYRRCKRFLKKGTWMKVVQQQAERTRNGEPMDLRIMDLPLHLMFAISQNGMYDRTFLRFLRLLLNYGYDPDIPDEKGVVALHAALMRVNFFSALASVRLLRRREVYTTKFVLALCQAGAHVNVHEDRGERTPLHVAAKCNLVHCVKILLDYGAEIEALDAEDKTALCLAAESAALESLECLLDHGACVNTCSLRRQTPLHRAVDALPTYNAERCVHLLLDEGADPNAQDINGNTPLHLATRSRAEGSIIHQLLLYEADASIQNALHHSALYEYLIAYSLPEPHQLASQLTLEHLESYPGFLALLESTPRSPRMIRNKEGRILPMLTEARLKPLFEQFDVLDEPQSLQSLCRQTIRLAVGIAPLVYLKNMVKCLGLPPRLEEYVSSARYRQAMRAPGLMFRLRLIS